MIGQTFHDWTVISEPWSEGRGAGLVVRCRCTCGIERVIRLRRLGKDSTNCGCWRKNAPKPTGMIKEGRFCGACFDMPWRRPTNGSCVCGESFEMAAPKSIWQTVYEMGARVP